MKWIKVATLQAIREAVRKYLAFLFFIFLVGGTIVLVLYFSWGYVSHTVGSWIPDLSLPNPLDWLPDWGGSDEPAPATEPSPAVEPGQPGDEKPQECQRWYQVICKTKTWWNG